jgi:hypothetical protein
MKEITEESSVAKAGNLPGLSFSMTQPRTSFKTAF